MNQTKLQTPSRKQFSKIRAGRQLVGNSILIGRSTRTYLSTVTNFARLVQKSFKWDMVSPDKISRIMRKSALSICEIKAANQLCDNCAAYQHLCFRHRDSTIPLLSKSEIFKPLAIFSGSTARFVSVLVGNPKDRFSLVAAHIEQNGVTLL